MDGQKTVGNSLRERSVGREREERECSVDR